MKVKLPEIVNFKKILAHFFFLLQQENFVNKKRNLISYTTFNLILWKKFPILTLSGHTTFNLILFKKKLFLLTLNFKKVLVEFFFSLSKWHISLLIKQKLRKSHTRIRVDFAFFPKKKVEEHTWVGQTLSQRLWRTLDFIWSSDQALSHRLRRTSDFIWSSVIICWFFF